MTPLELHDHVLQITEKFNCGSTLATLTPSVLFFWHFWCLADTYVATFLRSTDRRRDFRNDTKCCLKIIVTSILVWSGGQCWADGLIRFLNAYTVVFLTMINGSLESDYKMSQATINIIECMFKMAVCCSVVFIIRWCCINYNRNYNFNAAQIRRSRRTRLYNWYTLPGRQLSELGESGRLLWEIHPPPEPEHPVQTENSKPMKCLYTQSCHLLTNNTPILSKQIEKRRKSI